MCIHSGRKGMHACSMQILPTKYYTQSDRKELCSCCKVEIQNHYTNYMTRSFLASFALNFLENILSYVQQIRQLNYLAYQSDFEYCLYQYPAGKMIIWFKFAKAYNSSTSLNLSTLGTSFSPRYQVIIKINPLQFSDYISIIFYQSEIVVSFC